MVQTNERLYKWTNERPNGRLNYVVCREWTCRTLRTLWTLRACNKYNLNGANKQTSCKKVKVSQLFVIQINLLQNLGNLAKRPKSTILSFSLHFGIFNFYAIFVLGIIFLYMFTNSAIFFLSLLVYKQGYIFSKKRRKKIIALFVKWNFMSLFCGI